MTEGTCKPGFERVGQSQPSGDAGEDHRHVPGAKMEGGGQQGAGGGALLHRAGKLLAVLDEFAQNKQHAAGAGWWTTAMTSRQLAQRSEPASGFLGRLARGIARH